jgi:hypothetical protein
MALKAAHLRCPEGGVTSLAELSVKPSLKNQHGGMTQADTASAKPVRFKND